MRRVSLTILLLLPLLMHGQNTLDIDGDRVGYGIVRKGPMPRALQEMLRDVKARRTNNVRRAPSRASYAAATQTTDAVQPAIGPLLATVRAQETPYNDQCPTWTDENGQVNEARCLTGCVATSIEQVLTYYRFPKELKDTLFGWETPNYTIPDMLPGTTFNWQQVRNDYRSGWTPEQAEAVARLSLACGMAVHMNYGLDASGANFWWGTDNLRRAFGLEVVRCYDRVLYSPEHWHRLLRNELEHGHPLAYAGHNMELGGHAFNIDGVDARGFYHVNWGYGGSYDGWYDLDWLNPWEPTDIDSLGIAEGFFSNHYALVLHPTAEDMPLDADSLNMDSLGVVCDSITFVRQPDLQGMVPVDFHFRNTSQNAVTYTYEVMTWLPTDTAIFYQADYVGLAALTLQPGQCRTQRTYCHFTQQGERLFGISPDDVTLPFVTSVTIAAGTPPRLKWGAATVRLEADSAVFTVPVSNLAATGVAGNLVTFCLYPDGKEAEDLRHWAVLNLPAGTSQTLEVTFTGLDAATHYTFLVRCPWAIQATTDFTTGVHAIPASPQTNAACFDLSGRRVVHPGSRSGQAGHPRILISDGRKWLEQ